MRRRIHHGAWLLLLVAASAARAAERGGEDIYNATCSSCHGNDGRGAPAARTGLLVKPRDFTDCKSGNREPDHDWHAVIAEGGPARGFSRMMPAFGEVLSREEQETVLAFVRGFCPDPAWPRGDLNFPRAMVTEKAFVEDEFVITGGVATNSSRDTTTTLIYEQRFLRRQQFEIAVPFSVLQMTDGSREAGIGDVAIGLKSLLVASLATGSVFSIGGELALPTGNQDKGMGKGVAIVEPYLAFGQSLPLDGFLHTHVGVEIPTKESSGVDTEGYFRAALGRSFVRGDFGRTFTPMIEASFSREIASGAATAMDLLPQLQVSLSRRQHVQASLGASIPTLSREGRDTQVMFYLLWDFVDGGLFEAW